MSNTPMPDLTYHEMLVPDLSVRAETLRKAEALVIGEREVDYGPPSESLGRIAKLWSVVVEQELDPSQVAMMLALMKIARLCESAGHADSWVDLAGYAAIGAEVAAS